MSCFEPSLENASHRPATLPGTPAERWPSRESPAVPPAGRFLYVSCDAASGAFSRKSTVSGFPSTRATMKPPPPRLPAPGKTTASANAVATAASTALPPAWSTSSPTREASVASVTTIPCGAVTRAALAFHPAGIAGLGGIAEGAGASTAGATGATAGGCGVGVQPSKSVRSRAERGSLMGRHGRARATGAARLSRGGPRRW